MGKNAEKTDTSSQGKDDTSTDNSASAAQEPDGTPTASPEAASPITIEADTLRLDNSTQEGRFVGNVTAVKDATQLYADEMIVYITELPDGGNDVEKIEIFGNVKIINETQTVTGDKGLFLNLEQFAKIEGDPGKKARIEDTAQNLVLEAPVVEINLETNKVSAKRESTPEDEKTDGGSERIRMELGTDSTQSMFGTDVKEKDEEERFIVTEKTLETLQEADVPDDVVEDLSLLQDREFLGQDTFMEEVGKRIGADSADKYKKLLLKYAKVEEERSDEKNLPSVTIQPDAISTSQD